MFSITPLSFDVLSPRNLLKYIGTNLTYWQKLESIGLHLCRWPYRSTFIQIFTVSSERRMFFEIECIMTLGHPRSLILAPIESAYMTSYSTSIVTLVLSCRVSEILELLYAESHIFSTHPYSGENFGVFPLEQTRHVGVAKSEHHRLTNGKIIFQEFQCDHNSPTSQTDRQTDRQTDDIWSQYRALH